MLLRRMRWMSEGDGRWELDAETPATMEGTARPVPGDPLPLGLSRGPRVTRPKQLDFFHRFMASPFVPTFSASGDGLPSTTPTSSTSRTTGGGRQCRLGLHGLIENNPAFDTFLNLDRLVSFTILEQIHVEKLVSVVKEKLANRQEEAPWTKDLKKHLHDVMSLGIGTELLITPDTTLLLELYDIKKGDRGKAIFHHKAKNLDALKLFGIHLVICGRIVGNQNVLVVMKQVMFLLLCYLAYVLKQLSIKKSIDAWRKKEDKLKNVQPYDVFLSDSHVSFTGIVGAVASGYLGDCSRRVSIRDEARRSNAFRMFDERNKFAAFADLFASVTFTAQYGNFQRLFLDLTKASARFGIASGSLFLCGASQLAQDFFFSKRPDIQTFCDVCPDVTVSLQQQIVGPFSFRVESSVSIDPRSQDNFVRVDDSIFAIDWALKVLGSAKATAWYSPKHQEAMVELRFFEA
ncbi:hypothetical protein HU200_009750 [Digitaria exilis]|uniref:Protein TRIGALACTOSYLDIACYLGLYCEROL 4, chloroplastic n=1 Tax=Digitaria exilis TaxID=1010633 RepID=A0A835FJ25_9POAL|nr:hypothetical protein HU200_009750 [Digitaria exilis]